MNHSESPNCKTNMINGNVYAITNIKYGEQLFEDYSTFDHPTYLLPLLQKYKCVPNYYDAVFIEDLQEDLQAHELELKLEIEIELEEELELFLWLDFLHLQCLDIFFYIKLSYIKKL